MAERLAHNQKVAGSSPALATQRLLLRTKIMRPDLYDAVEKLVQPEDGEAVDLATLLSFSLLLRRSLQAIQYDDHRFLYPKEEGFDYLVIAFGLELMLCHDELS